jgi:hypothetical protein
MPASGKPPLKLPSKPDGAVQRTTPPPARVDRTCAPPRIMFKKIPADQEINELRKRIDDELIQCARRVDVR